MTCATCTGRRTGQQIRALAANWGYIDDIAPRTDAERPPRAVRPRSGARPGWAGPVSEHDSVPGEVRPTVLKWLQKLTAGRNDRTGACLVPGHLAVGCCPPDALRAMRTKQAPPGWTQWRLSYLVPVVGPAGIEPATLEL